MQCPNTSEQLPRGISPSSPVPMAQSVQTISGEEVPFGAGKIDSDSPKRMPPSPQGSSQTGMADDMAHTCHSPSLPPLPRTPEATSVPSALHSQASPRAIFNTPSDEVLHLQEEMNNAMSHLLTLQASLDAHQWRLVSDTETTLHQNEAKASEAIKVVKACYATSILETEALYVSVIKEVEANYSTSIMEMEGGHVTAMQDVKAACTAHAFDLQQAHGETIWALESEAIEEDG